MKFSTPVWLALGFVAVTPAALPAATAQEGEIEHTLRHSYVLRTVLSNQVIVKAYRDHVTLGGSALDEDAVALAVDTAENTPGVSGVTNNIRVVSRYAEGSDPWIAVRIRNRLLVQAGVSALTTAVSVRDGVATLGGTATSTAQKDLTGAYARETEGVTSVKNNLIVKGEPGPAEHIDDASVTAQVKLALRRHRATRGLRTVITTVDGVVRITGDAALYEEKSLVTQLAQAARGAVAVTNEMTVNHQAAR